MCVFNDNSFLTMTIVSEQKVNQAFFLTCVYEESFRLRFHSRKTRTSIMISNDNIYLIQKFIKISYKWKKDKIPISGDSAICTVFLNDCLRSGWLELRHATK